MIVEQAARLNPPARKPIHHILLSWLLAMASLFWSRGAVLGIIAGVWVVTLIVYQFPVQATLSLTDQPSPVRILWAYPPEAATVGGQRWTSSHATIIVPGVGSGRVWVRLRFFGGAQDGAGRVLTIQSGEQTVVRTPIRPDWQEIRLLTPLEAIDATTGDLALTLAIPPFTVIDDERVLGVSLHEMHVSVVPDSPWMPIERVGRLALIALLLFWSLRATGLPIRWSLISVGAAFLGLAWLIAGGNGQDMALRLQGALAVAVLVQVLPITLALALIVLGATSAWGWRRVQLWAIAVRGAVLLIFTLRLAGLMHPQFVPIDHGLRAHQLLHIASGREFLVRDQLEQQWEWGTSEPIPYSLLTYYLLLPLTLIWQDQSALIGAVKVVSSALEAGVPLMLWALLRGAPLQNAAAAGASLCYAALPAGYLFFHDGSFPTTIGIWLTLLALVAVRWIVANHEATGGSVSVGARRVIPYVLGVGLLASAFGAYVTHIAFVPFLTLTLAASLYWLGGAPPLRRAALSIILTLALALPIGWALAYASYTRTLIERTIPAFLGLIAAEGSVGQNSELFFGTPINSFAEHMVAHFRVWPAALAAVTLVVLFIRARSSFSMHLGLAFTVFLAATSLAERWFGLWNKHMVFAAPGIAMLAGIGLAWLWRRGWAGRIVCVGLLLYLFGASTFAWANRSLWYILPPEAL